VKKTFLKLFTIATVLTITLASCAKPPENTDKNISCEDDETAPITLAPIPDTTAPDSDTSPVTRPYPTVTADPTDTLTLSPSSVELTVFDVTGEAYMGKSPTAEYKLAAANFGVKLFAEVASKEGNQLISPYSVMTVLQLAANGAANKTLTEFESMLGGIGISELNAYLTGVTKAFGNGLTSANSLWIRNETAKLNVNEKYLEDAVKYFGASVYSAPFNTDTVKDINAWISHNTKGRVQNMLNKLDESTLTALVNAVTFDAKWQSGYSDYQVNNGDFTDIYGKKCAVSMMTSVEHAYIDNNEVTGFIKPYDSGYSFVALLPRGDIKEYIASLTGEKLLDTVSEARTKNVVAKLPCFTYGTSYELNDAISHMGWNDAFDPDKADFSEMGSTSLGNGRICIGGVIHQAQITVDKAGTQAGAATIVTSAPGSSGNEETYYVTLDRPFVYLIIDNATSLPLFIGSFETIK